jgi:hypothetical protein
MRLTTTLTLEKRDQNGFILDRREQPSRSWLKNYINMMYVLSGYGVNTIAAVTDIGGTSRAFGASKNSYLHIGSPAGYTTLYPFVGGSNMVLGENMGVVVGSGSTAVTPTDSKLETQILHGETSGKLLFSSTELYAITFTNPNGSFKIQRYFTNKSSGNVTIEECGIYALGGSTYSFCICRDIVSPAVVVATTEILLVTYTVGITV